MKVNPHNLAVALRGYNQYTVNYLVNGFTFGFCLGCVRIPDAREPPKNHPPVLNNPDAAKELVFKEVRLGRVLGPFKTCPIPGLLCSPLNLVPKANSPGCWHLIHNLAFPYDHNSVNANIPDEQAQVYYIPFDRAIQICQSLGAGCFIGKQDFDAAFRLLPIAKQDLSLLGFMLEGNYFVNSLLAFGARSSCRLFETFASGVQFALEKWTNSSTVLHYLDDFFLAKTTYQECAHFMEQFEELTAFIGAPLSPNKKEGPATHLTFLGIEIDTIKQQISIPEIKRQQALELVLKAMDHRGKKVTVRFIQKLTENFSL